MGPSVTSDSASLDLFPPHASEAPGQPHPHVRAIRKAVRGGLRRMARRVFRRAAPRGRTILVEAVERAPDTWGGAAVVRGTRVPVFILFDIYRKEGLDGVLTAFPHLTEADAFAALSYADLRPEAIERDRQKYLARLPTSEL